MTWYDKVVDQSVQLVTPDYSNKSIEQYININIVCYLSNIPHCYIISKYQEI